MLMAILLLRYQAEALLAVLHMLAVGLVCTVPYKLIKHKTLRLRPFNVYPSIICNSQPLDQLRLASCNAVVISRPVQQTRGGRIITKG